MSVVILGGNECMVRQYKSLCQSFDCSAKVFPKLGGSLKGRLGSPDLLVLFTDTISHKMMQNALNEAKGGSTVVERVRSSSMSALRGVLQAHTEAG